MFHGITHSELQHAQAPEQVLKELLETLYGKIVVVHFRHIEREFLRQISLNIWDEAIEFPVLDTLEIERQLLDKQRSLWQRITRRPLPSIRLGQSRMRYHLPPYSPHHALTDAIATAENCFKRSARTISHPTLPFSLCGFRLCGFRLCALWLRALYRSLTANRNSKRRDA